jgi:hypothetical protein
MQLRRHGPRMKWASPGCPERPILWPHLGCKVNAGGHDAGGVVLEAASLDVEPFEVGSGRGLEARDASVRGGSHGRRRGYWPAAAGPRNRSTGGRAGGQAGRQVGRQALGLLQ